MVLMIQMKAIDQVPKNVRESIYETVNLMGPFGSQRQGDDLAECHARYYLEKYETEQSNG